MPSKVEDGTQQIIEQQPPDIVEALVEASALAVPSRELQLSRRPAAVMKEAAEVADLLSGEIFKRVKPANIRGKKYPLVEHWTTVASFFGVFTKITETKYVEFETGQGKVHGWEAHAQAFVVATGQVISEADAMCCDDEPTWEARPLHALRAMAQTRAVGRVLRNPFSRIMVLAGIEATPAEEMPGTENGRPSPALPTRASEAKPISKPQGKRLWAIARKNGWKDDEVKALLQRHGYEHTQDIRISDYDAIVQEVEQGRETEDRRATQEEPQPTDWGGEVPPPDAEAKTEKPTEFTIRCTFNADKKIKTALITGHTDFVKERMQKVYGALYNNELGGYVLAASWVHDLSEWCAQKGIVFVEQ